MQVRGAPLLLSFVSVVVGGCDRWGSQQRAPEATWTVELVESRAIDVDQTTNDLFAVVWEPGPVLTRLAAGDGSRVWSVPLPEQAVTYGVSATLAGADVVLVAWSEEPFVIDGVPVPAGSWILRWAQTDGRWVSTTAAPGGWGRLDLDGTTSQIAGGTDGSVAAAYCKLTGCRGEVTVVEVDGSVAWSVIPGNGVLITTIARSPDGDVLVGAGLGGIEVGRLRRADGAVAWSTPLAWFRIDGIRVGADGGVYAIGAVSDDVTLIAMTPTGEGRWQAEWVPSDGQYARGGLDIGVDGHLYVTVLYAGSVTYGDQDFEGVGNDGVIAALTAADGTLAKYAEFGGTDQRTICCVVGGSAGRVYVSGANLIALDLP